MRKEPYWLDESWPGRLAVGPRPRGGEWLKDDVSSWKRAHIDAVLSLLTPDEEQDLDLREEAGEVRAQGMSFTSFPIPDRQTPKSESKLAEVLELATRDLSDGRNVLVHCRQGIGPQRSGGGLSTCEKGSEPGGCSRFTLGSARRVCTRNTQATRLDRPSRHVDKVTEASFSERT